jgi:hypothetical protein
MGEPWHPLSSALPHLKSHTPLPAGLDASSVEWGRLSPRGRAILQLVGTRITLGKSLTEISNELRASPTTDGQSTAPPANAQGPTVSG